MTIQILGGNARPTRFIVERSLGTHRKNRTAAVVATIIFRAVRDDFRADGGHGERQNRMGCHPVLFVGR